MNKLKKAGTFVIAATAILGFKFHSKASTAKAVQQEMISVCSTDRDCTDAVNTYFKSCFNSSYSMGSRRRASSLDTQKLANCINSNSGVEFFGI
ncbi:MAG: hypothetical protein AAF383_04855 [Cyanobacteria bacterium P01_A01_bin.83]